MEPAESVCIWTVFAVITGSALGVNQVEAVHDLDLFVGRDEIPRTEGFPLQPVEPAVEFIVRDVEFGTAAGAGLGLGIEGAIEFGNHMSGPTR